MNMGLNIQVILLKECKILTKKKKEERHHKESCHALFKPSPVRLRAPMLFQQQLSFCCRAVGPSSHLAVSGPFWKLLIQTIIKHFKYHLYSLKTLKWFDGSGLCLHKQALIDISAHLAEADVKYKQKIKPADSLRCMKGMSLLWAEWLGSFCSFGLVQGGCVLQSSHDTWQI